MLGSPAGLMFDGFAINTGFDPVTLTDSTADLIAWYDFTDPSTVYRDNSGINNIAADENIGRINNKVQSTLALGKFLRCIAATQLGGGPGDDGNSFAPTFKLNGTNGYSYASFDSSANSGSGQCLVGSDYRSFTGPGANGHGGGVGNGVNVDSIAGSVGYYSGLLNNGDGAPNHNTFSQSSVKNDDLTIFWVVKPSTANPSGTGDHCHWLIRPDDSSDSGTGRFNETYFEGFTRANGDNFMARVNSEDQGGSGITYITSTDLDVTDSVNIFMARFNSGSGGFILFQNGANIASGTITSSSTYNMDSGMMALGRWSLGNINSGSVADSAFDGQFYEIIVYNKAISDTELVTANTALLAKYN